MIKEDIEKVLSEFTDDHQFTIRSVVNGDAFEIRDRILEALNKDKLILIPESFANIENLLSEAKSQMDYLEREFKRV